LANRLPEISALGQAVRCVRRQRNRTILRHGRNGKVDGSDQTALGRWEDFATRLDLPEAISLVGLACQCFAGLRHLFYFALAGTDVDPLLPKGLHQGLSIYPQIMQIQHVGSRN